MGHLGAKNEVYRALAYRLNQNPVGAPFSETLIQILYLMFQEKEAELGSRFPAGFTTAERLSHTTGIPEADVIDHLNKMADKGLVIDVSRKENTFYMLAPLVIGFFEYTFMRTGGTLPLKDLAELFERYHNEIGVAEEFFGAETKIFQTWLYESLITPEVKTEVLHYELASEMIRDAGGGSLTMCYCRHQAAHRGKACDAPVNDVCTVLGNTSEWLVRRGFSRPASADELLRVLDRTEELGLVHLADNVRQNPAFICHCCTCCCAVLSSINEHGVRAVQPSNFVPYKDQEACNGCGDCVNRCPVHAIKLIDIVTGEKKSKKTAVQEDLCIGCGACIRSCARGALRIIRRDRVHLPPLDKKEQMLRIAREKGRL